MDEKVLITKSSMDAIGDAIRDRNGLLTKYLPSEVPTAIESIPNNYILADEGKVVKNGALVAQTARATEITENGTYDTTENNEVTVDVSGGGTDVIISNNLPTSDIGVDGQYYIYEEESASIKYGIQVIAAARDTDYAFTYWGVRDIDFVFTDGTAEYHLRNFSNAHCYWASGTGSFTQQDGNINGQTANYYEHIGLPGWYEISADVPAGLVLSKVRICGRNDSSWHDFFRTFKIGQWSSRRTFINTLISEQDLVLGDWDTSSPSAYTEFALQSPAQPIRVTARLYRKNDGVWIQYD